MSREFAKMVCARCLDLGASIAESEDAGFWSTLFRSLKDRGLEGVELVVSDAHKGTLLSI